ncbi:MAG: anaerobic ribonucleoside-triphosphate reductase activating protein [Erysipelotrichaceae bacterium]|nr:anaerobic ribonucleoside-triphosphate reductase activating protein [Erysipelotrichaceae bacterium]
MNYASIKNCDVANGIGVRVSLFVSGCTHYCKGCFNSEAWDFDYGDPFDSQAQEKVLNLLKPKHISGLTLLGGEPLDPANQIGLIPFIRKFKQEYPDKTLWCYSGYTYEYITDVMFKELPYTKELLSYIDVLVDGKFVEELKDLRLRFKGSSNQRIIDIKKSLESNEIVLWEEEK